jgi:hypothetical protein
MIANTDVELTVNETAGHCPDNPDMLPLSWTVWGGGGVGAGGGAVPAAPWFTVNDTLPAIKRPDRAAPLFVAADMVMAALAFPLAPDAIVNQGASVVAVQAHPESVAS